MLKSGRLPRKNKLPPAEAAPQFLLQHPGSLALGDWFVLMHQPIAYSDGDPGLFGVNHDNNGYHLNANFGNPDKQWNSNNRFVFCKSSNFSPGFCWESFVFVND